jgi:NAD-dependent SIR2 family protein deacetylase
MRNSEPLADAHEAVRAAASLLRACWSLTASWPILREIFYDHFGAAKPNRAHEVLAAWEARGLLKVLITQNIDSAQLN